jgi:hypothetical protein
MRLTLPGPCRARCSGIRVLSYSEISTIHDPLPALTGELQWAIQNQLHFQFEILHDRRPAILYHNMDAQPQVTEVEWLQDGVNICFDDGRTALFSTALLYANLPVRKGLQTAQ